MSTETDPMAEIRASFFIECEELLEALQDSLQGMDDGAGDDETINIVFRAVHSIKGGAGAFGLESLVRFAHRYETVLDEVRGGRILASPDAMKVFFRAADHLSDLVRVNRDGDTLPEDTSAQLLTELDAFLPDAAIEAETAEEAIDFQPTGLALDLDLGDAPASEDMPFDLDNLPPPPPLAGIPAAPTVSPLRPRPRCLRPGTNPRCCCATFWRWGKGRSPVICPASPRWKNCPPIRPT